MTSCVDDRDSSDDIIKKILFRKLIMGTHYLIPFLEESSSDFYLRYILRCLGGSIFGTRRELINRIKGFGIQEGEKIKSCLIPPEDISECFPSLLKAFLSRKGLSYRVRFEDSKFRLMDSEELQRAVMEYLVSNDLPVSDILPQEDDGRDEFIVRNVLLESEPSNESIATMEKYGYTYNSTCEDYINMITVEKLRNTQEGWLGSFARVFAERLDWRCFFFVGTKKRSYIDIPPIQDIEKLAKEIGATWDHGAMPPNRDSNQRGCWWVPVPTHDPPRKTWRPNVFPQYLGEVSQISSVKYEFPKEFNTVKYDHRERQNTCRGRCLYSRSNVPKPCGACDLFACPKCGNWFPQFAFNSKYNYCEKCSLDPEISSYVIRGYGRIVRDLSDYFNDGDEIRVTTNGAIGIYESKHNGIQYEGQIYFTMNSFFKAATGLPQASIGNAWKRCKCKRGGSWTIISELPRIQ